MSGQELLTYAVGALTALYLGLRYLRRRRADTCCGARVCPAAKELERRLARERRPGA